MTDKTNPTSIEILLVEDNPGDVDLTRAALRKCKVFCNLTVAKNGVEALAILRRKGEHVDAVRPDLIMLDLNLPKLHGHEVLSQIKEDLTLKRIPVVVVTSSKAEEDVAKSYDLHANCYVTKPVDLDQFRTVVSAVEDFWFSVVKLPPVA